MKDDVLSRVKKWRLSGLLGVTALVFEKLFNWTDTLVLYSQHHYLTLVHQAQVNFCFSYEV